MSDDYDQLLVRLDQQLPDIAAQVRAHVAAGRPQSFARQQLTSPEIQYRQRLLRDSGHQTLREEDVTSISYSDTERVELIQQALLTLAETMHSTRNALTDLANRHGIADLSIGFYTPPLDEASESVADEVGEIVELPSEAAEPEPADLLTLSEELESTAAARQRVRTFLEPETVTNEVANG